MRSWAPSGTLAIFARAARGTLGPAPLQQAHPVRGDDQTPLQAIRNRFDSDIVMRRANAASSEDVVKGVRERHDVTGNHLDLIRDHHDTSDIYTQGRSSWHI